MVKKAEQLLSNLLLPQLLGSLHVDWFLCMWRHAAWNGVSVATVAGLSACGVYVPQWLGCLHVERATWNGIRIAAIAGTSAYGCMLPCRVLAAAVGLSTCC